MSSVMFFALGVYGAMRAIAALYRVLDLWYTIGTEYRRVLGGIVLWGGLIAAVILVAGDRGRAAFLWGLAAFPAFYLSLYVLRSFLFRRPAA